MAGGVIFSFKCPQGHLTDRRFPPGTPYDDNDEITCPRCRSIIDIQPDGVPFGTPFTWAAGKRSDQVMLPPLHPSCRCTANYKVVRSALEAA